MRDVLERWHVEVAGELAVEDPEHVEIELTGDTGRVVVGGNQPRGALDEVDAEQECVAVAERRGDVVQEPCTLPRRQVPDRAAEERE